MATKLSQDDLRAIANEVVAMLRATPVVAPATATAKQPNAITAAGGISAAREAGTGGVAVCGKRFATAKGFADHIGWHRVTEGDKEVACHAA